MRSIPFRKLLCLVGCMLALTVTVYAESAQSGDHWTLDQGTLVVDYPGEMDLSAGIPWEEVKSQVTTVRIQEGTTSIGEGAFQNCENLTKVELPASILKIEKDGFRNCENLCWITLPEKMEQIWDGAFLECAKLKTIVIPRNLGSIDQLAFEPTTRIRGYTGSAAEDYARSRGSTFSSCGNRMGKGASGAWSDTINWTLDAYGTLTLSGQGECPKEDAPWNEYRSDIRCVKVESGVTNLPEGIFRNCRKLKTVELTDGLTSIGAETFRYCTALEQIEIPASVQTVGENALDANVTILGADVETVVTPAEEPTETPTEAPAEEPAEEPAEAPAEELEPEVPVKEQNAPATGFRITAETVETKAGEAVQVRLTIADNPGICALSFGFNYDDSALTLKGYDCPSGMDLTQWTLADHKLLWVNTTAWANSGDILTLSFQVAEDASGKEYSLEFLDVTALDASGNPIIMQAENGLIRVAGSVAGDVNGDGMVNAIDSLMLKQHLVGQIPLDQLPGADINQDGTVDLQDLLKLSQMLDAQ